MTRPPITCLTAFVVLGWLAAPLAAAAGPLERIAAVRELTREQAALAQAVHVRGVVTWSSSSETFAIQDDSAGIWVSLNEARNRKLWQGDNLAAGQIREGMEVEIEGVSARGGYAPIILPVTLRVLGIRPQPTPRPLEPARFFSGSDDCQRIEVRGTVQGFQHLPNGVNLVINANPGRFTAQLSRQVVANPADLVDAEIRLRGVAATRFNSRGEATGSRVITSLASDLFVEKPPPPRDRVPQVSLDHLLPFRAEPTGPHRVRVEGTVTFSLPGQFFYLQEDDCAVRVETNSPVPLKLGDRVQAAGFVDISRLIGMLRDATVHPLGDATLPAAVVINPEEILEVNQVALGARQVALPYDYDGHLIRCRARLLAVQSEPHISDLSTLTLERTNTLGGGKMIFKAVLHDGQSQRLAALQPGSELELTGLVQLQYERGESPLQTTRTIPVNLDLILRHEGDVVVLSKPSWWTPGNLTAVLAAVLLALGGAMLWNLQLKSQVRKKSRMLAQEKNARRDAAMEFRTTMRERNRLAANLHDTLPQTMSAIGLQLDACEYSLRRQGIESLPPLEMVRTMVGFAVKELRGAVWEMRSFSLRGRSFSAALQTVVDRVAVGHSAAITVRTEGPLEKIPEFVSGNLLLIVQEALRNALQHGKARKITVEVSTAAPGASVRLIVLDDGAGFAPGSQNGPEQGHYGIVGMRERAERLGGSLQVESSPGNGTRIIAEVSQHADDDDLAEDQNLPDAAISKARGE